MILAFALEAALCAATVVSGPHGGDRAVFHSTAVVNDPLSHGTLGDLRLSLNEAIQLHNQTLTFAQLSPAEQFQIIGNTDIGFIDLDGNLTPQITLERDLDPIVDTAHGFILKGFPGGPPVLLDFAPVTRGFVADSSLCTFENLELRGAPVAVDVTQSVSAGGIVVKDVRFVGAMQTGVRMVLNPVAAPAGRLTVQGCTFDGPTDAIVVDETAVGATNGVFVVDTEIRNAQRGLELTLGSGGSSVLLLENVDIAAAVAGVAVRRAPGADRALTCQVSHVGVSVAAGTAVAIDGDPVGRTRLDVRLADLQGGGVGLGFQLTPAGSLFDGMLQDLHLVGGAEVHAGGAPLLISNAVAAGSITVAAHGGGSMDVRDTLVRGGDLQVVGPTAVTVRACSIEGGVVGSGVATVMDSFVGGTNGPNATVSLPVPSAMLGSFDVAPRRAFIGGSFTFNADLPPGFLGVFVVGPSRPLQVISPTIRVYMSQSEAITLSGIYRLQQGITANVPPFVSLSGTDWVAQMAVFGDPGTVGPALSLPPGHRFFIE